MEVRLEASCEAEMDGQWPYVGKKSGQRWLWYAIGHAASTILAYVFGRRKDGVFKELKALPQPSDIARHYTDGWGAYGRHLDIGKHGVGKRDTQETGRKNLNLRTWVKRLTRKTSCFSKLALMHGTVIGVLINKVGFGIDIHAKLQV
jgi:insertion element IS1 protein InsB